MQQNSELYELMKKGILLLIAMISLGLGANAQTITKRDAKKVSKEINRNINKIEKAIEKTDWRQVQKVVDKTATSIEKNAEGVVEIIESVDFSKLVNTLSKMAEQLEDNIDVQKLERAVENIGAKVEKAIEVE